MRLTRSRSWLRAALLLALSSFVVTAGASRAEAAVAPNPLFADHAVLQQGAPIPVWGTADPGEIVTVKIAKQAVSATAGADGKWLVRLAPMKAGGPFTLTITGSGTNTVVLRDVLVGEVWVCGGQSNMERNLGLAVGQQPIENWEQEVAAARFPKIRHFAVAHEKSLTPVAAVKGHWEVASPDTVKDFTAVGYFFGRDLHRARHVPVGLIHSSWGGTPAEAWTSEAGLRALPDFAELPEQLRLLAADPQAAKRRYEEQLEDWFVRHDAGSTASASWSARGLDLQRWKTMNVPGLWENAGEPELNGVVWFRRTFDLPATAAKLPAELALGMVDDVDTTWINGVKVATTVGYNLVRRYAVPAGVLRPGRNVVTVRVLDTGGGGGFWGAQKVELVFGGAGQSAPPSAVPLSGPWLYRVGMRLEHAPAPPTAVTGDVHTPTVLWNGMIAPLVPYAIRGVVWYQGESNVRREQQYRTLFPATIASWRAAWGADFPFLFVQIAPHRDMTPELRDAQLWTWRHTPKTAMVVTTDAGDENDIHPTRKQPVGARLALAARALAHGERIEYSGPLFDSMKIDGKKALLRFTRAGRGLVARTTGPQPKQAGKGGKGEDKGSPAATKRGALTGFTIAGADGVFHPAEARIHSRDTVVVTSEAVPTPAAVRYGWANVPDANLFNVEGLPASPFRTDED